MKKKKIFATVIIFAVVVLNILVLNPLNLKVDNDPFANLFSLQSACAQD
jgi:hypothetical protein